MGVDNFSSAAQWAPFARRALKQAAQRQAAKRRFAPWSGLFSSSNGSSGSSSKAVKLLEMRQPVEARDLLSLATPLATPLLYDGWEA